MSRLEQMREHFLQRVYAEQKQQQQQRFKLSSAKSIQNIPCAANWRKSSISSINGTSNRTTENAKQQQQQHRMPSRLQTTLSVKTNTNGTLRTTVAVSTAGRANITRVKSLCNVSLIAASTTLTTRVANKSTSVNNSANGKKVNSSSNNSRRRQPLHLTLSLPPTSSVNTKTNQDQKGKIIDLLECKVCSRKFSTRDRLEKHAEICEKISSKQRPVFNSGKQRLKHIQAGDVSESEMTKTNADVEGKVIEEKAKWKQAHRQFIEAIQQARAQKTSTTPAVVIEEENLSTCAYCERGFSPAVIGKHETICAKLFRKKSFDV